MPPSSTRRTLLSAGGTAACVALAGCSVLGEPDPDAGRDSYGVRLENTLREPYTVALTGETFLENTVVWEERVEVGPEEEREWEQVFTEPKHYLLRASIEEPEVPETYREHHNSVNVGKETSPEAENAVATIQLIPDADDEEIPGVWVTPPGR